MSWLIQVFIENTRMSHFFLVIIRLSLCHCPTCYLFFYVIARLDRAICFFSPALNIITCTSQRHCSAFFSLVIAVTSLCHCPTWSGNLFAAAANFPDASVKPEHPFITHFLSAVMPRLSLFCHAPAWPGHLPAFSLSPIASPAGNSQTGQSEFACSAWINCRGRVLSFHSKNHAVFNLTFPRVRPVEN